jgi:uncharacterized membrane protein
VTLGLAGWLSGLWTLALPGNPPMTPWKLWTVMCITAAVFAAAFAAPAILQYRALNVPHGDAGMYEEHLWNFLHGKGFRSQLDDGRLFLGEHVEVIHLLLLPFHWLYPELTTLNVCQALALASGAIAVFGLSRTLLLPARAGACLAAAYLCYFPMQALALEATWKSFRPENFGPPLLLFAFWALEAERMRASAFLFFLSFLAKEEYALVAACAGVSLCLRGRWRWGIALAVGGIALLAIAVLLVIPYFRAGAPPHYAAYFKSFGDAPSAIVGAMLANPGVVLGRLFSADSMDLALKLVAPLLFLPFISPVRLLVAAPIFAYLALADAPMLRAVQFHFHAPLVGVLPWAAVGGLANLAQRTWLPNRVARFALVVAVLTCILFGRGPMSYRFYDPLFGVPREPSPPGVQIPELFKPEGSYWRDLYLPTPRSQAFREAQQHVRPQDRVAATDYIRTRFTHCQAAHDYPRFRGHVTIDDVDVFALDRTEGYWGRDRRTNLDHALLDALESKAPVGTRVPVRGRPFVVAYHDDYFLVLRRIPP